MDFEDSRLALFPEPNAYIQKFDKEDCKKTGIKKIVFQEPYESVPAFHIDNHFVKRDCDCVRPPQRNDCNCDKIKKQNKHFECEKRPHRNHQETTNNGFGFDIKGMLPLLSLFGKGGGADLNNLVGLMTNNSSNGASLNTTSLITNLLSNKEALSGILNIFKGGGFSFGKKQGVKKEIKSTDFEIKNYTRVE